MRNTLGVVLLSVALTTLPACGDDDGSPAGPDAGGAGGADAGCPIDETYDPTVDPQNFVATIDNPLWPLTPGTRYVFGGAEDVEVQVTRETKVILGVTTVVVRD